MLVRQENVVMLTWDPFEEYPTYRTLKVASSLIYSKNVCQTLLEII
jgi:hypothetical protein